MSGETSPRPRSASSAWGASHSESGETLTNVEQGWALLGTLSPERDDVVLVLHRSPARPATSRGGTRR